MPPNARNLATNAVAARAIAIAAAVIFAAFVAGKGIPTLRHDWSWPIDRLGIASWVDESFGGWLSVGFGVANTHPTAYLIALPLAAVMWLLGPLAALALLALLTGYLCASSAAGIALRASGSVAAAAGLGLFAVFNPWVYNEVVAGHLPMVLAYGAVLALIAEMSRGTAASPVRLALLLALIEVQLQFFILAFASLVVLACATKKWLPVFAGIVVALPSVVGLVAERATLVRIPYGIAWQTNQSVSPGALLGLGGYFAGYADRLGTAGFAAACALFALALCGLVAARRNRAAVACAVAAALLFVVVLGVRGPFAAPYAWLVREVPESGVFRELYDLAGVVAALLVLPACAAIGRFRPLAFLALAAGATLPIAWLLAPPGDLWVGANSYPRPAVVAPAYSRVALLPAFQPLQLRSGGGDGADPDVINYPHHVAALNQYLPTYPVDVALARYERDGDATTLRALGVSEIVDRPWFVSRSNGAIGLAAGSLAARAAPRLQPLVRYLSDVTPLVSQCYGSRDVALANRLGDCSLFFGDAPGYAVEPVRADNDSIDARSAWIDARLAFAQAPELAQGIGGELTQSSVTHSVRPQSWLLAYVRGRLNGTGGHALLSSSGAFAWLFVPAGVTSVSCAGLCELVAQAPAPPPNGRSGGARAQALSFREITPFLYVVNRLPGAPSLLRLNERFDEAWVALAAWRTLAHVRVNASVNGWFLSAPAGGAVVLVQVASLLQLIAEIGGLACVLWLLKALFREPTKRAT